jgi:hypothetical protein
MLEQLSVFLENQPGRLAHLCRTLGDAGVNMRALMVADTQEFGVVRIICDRPQGGRAALEKAGFGVSVAGVIGVEVPDTPGALADVLEALGREGVNVEYAYCFIEPGMTGAVDVLKVDDDRAVDVLCSAGYRVLRPEDLYVPDDGA